MTTLRKATWRCTHCAALRGSPALRSVSAAMTSSTASRQPASEAAAAFSGLRSIRLDSRPSTWRLGLPQNAHDLNLFPDS